MCLSPLLIKNPYSGIKLKAGDPRSLHDCTSEYIYVPCGHCPQCIAVKQMYYVQRVQMESLENHLFFATLTYNKESLPHVATSTGYSIPYTDPRDLQCMFKRLRKSDAFGRPFSYFAVSERGSTYGRPHAHILFSVPKYEGDTFLDCLNLESVMFDAVLKEWRRNVAQPVWSEKSQKWRPNTRCPVYRPLCDYYRKFIGGRLSATYDLHYAMPSATDEGLASVAFYVLKYMLKPSSREKRLQQALHLNLPEEEYEAIWSLVRSRCFTSLHYGDNPSAREKISSSIRLGLDNKSPYPLFVNPDSGQTFPLAPYYRKKADYFSFDDALAYYYANDSHDSRVDTVFDPDHKALDRIIKSYHDYEKTLDSTRLDILDALD